MSTAGGMRIPLTQGFYAVVDAEDFADVSRFKWRTLRCPNTTYAQRQTRQPDGTLQTVLLHTYLTGYGITDHRDGDGLNNRRVNLREATTRQNGGNRRSGGGSSRYRGVCWHTRKNKWFAREVWRDDDGVQRQRSLGYFTNEEDAARAFDAVARERWGSFAALNFPGPGEQSAIR